MSFNMRSPERTRGEGSPQRLHIDLQEFGDLPPAFFTGFDPRSRLGDSLPGELERTAYMLPSLLGGSHSGSGAFGDQPALELRECAHDVKDETASGGRRVDLFGQRHKAHALFPKALDHANQMFKGATQPIQLPHNQDIAFFEFAQGDMQTGPRTIRTREAMIFDNLTTASLSELLFLQIEVLVVGRDAGVADFHPSIMPIPLRPIKGLVKSAGYEKGFEGDKGNPFVRVVVMHNKLEIASRRTKWANRTELVFLPKHKRLLNASC